MPSINAKCQEAQNYAKKRIIMLNMATPWAVDAYFLCSLVTCHTLNIKICI